MPKVTVWKCPRTGKLFEDEKKYRSHLNKLARARRQEREQTRLLNTQVEFYAKMRATVRNIDQLIQYVKDNWQEFAAYAYLNDAWGRKVKNMPEVHPDITMWKIEYFDWNDNVSCSHSAPFGKKTNWGAKDKNIPTSYPGWKGRMHWQTADASAGKSTYPYSSDLWQGTGLHSGCGGYAGTYYCQFDMFEEDWPAMAESYDMARTYKEFTDDRRKIDEIAIDMFNTDEKCAAFKEQHHLIKLKFEKAKIWKILKSDRRPIREIMKEC